MRLTKSKSGYFINKPKEFEGLKIKSGIILSAFEFAYNMAYGDGYHRNHRSGGSKKRTSSEIFNNTLQGKIAEVVLYNYALNNGIKCDDVDFSVSNKGIWDDADLKCSNYKINVKSIAYYSNLLLLEAKDWDRGGIYIPNMNNSDSKGKYDYFVIVRVNPNTNSFKHETTDYDSLKKNILSKDWYYDFAGCCSFKTIQFIIKEQYVIPKGARLNGKIKMDADNYYIQAGDLKDISYLIKNIRE